uniref:ATP synthase F(0) complex subunit e, mitochondrial n=1 Tax=Anolis carolinensis TaxID=28377 RepID=A0A803TF07_ANOCA
TVPPGAQCVSWPQLFHFTRYSALLLGMIYGKKRYGKWLRKIVETDRSRRARNTKRIARAGNAEREQAKSSPRNRPESKSQEHQSRK